MVSETISERAKETAMEMVTEKAMETLQNIASTVFRKYLKFLRKSLLNKCPVMNHYFRVADLHLVDICFIDILYETIFLTFVQKV